MNYFRENIEKMTGYEPGFQPTGSDVIKLNTNENPYPPSPKVFEAIRNIIPPQIRKYPQPLGDTFRLAAAKVLGVEQENIICTNGGDDLLNMAIRAICDENRPLAYPTPTYSLYPELAKIQNCPALEVPFDSEFNLPPKLAKTGAALTIVCNPNAPSGTLISCQEIRQLAQEIKGVLLIDEAYVDFAENDCLELAKNLENVIILRSMSKGYSLAGLRFGFGIASKTLIKGLMKVKDSYNVDAIAIAAATAAIEDQEFHKETVAKIKKERKSLTEKLKQLGFEVPQSQTNFVFAKSVKMRAIDVYEKLKERNIYVRYWAYPDIKDKMRITVGTAEENEKLIKALEEILSRNE
ncbi:MAG: histidinol-phosphate transaminase [Planctomycetes bacterium GWF2_42_9]|nr:MAG: histidinol-phosphate transaminase [Planctomycetes bacterium GWF2_42_9]HAL46086.1 histidinol-phosphate transaminase [Phycisphaerales bacterium]